jgi:hypothetical protein
MLETWLVIIPRTLLAYLFLAAAADGFSYLIRGKELFDAPLSAAGKEFLQNLKRYPVIWAMKVSIDLIAGLMLILNFHAPLALLLILPSSVVIILFQFFTNKVGPIGILLTVLMLAMGAHYAPLYAPLLNAEDGRGPFSSGPYGHPGEPAP